VWRRFPLYAAATVLVIGAQALVVFVFRVPNGIAYSGFILPPLLTTLVYAFVWTDTEPVPEPGAATWERVLERSWAVILIDLFVTLVQANGVAGILDPDPIVKALGVAVLVLTAPLVFVDASATVDNLPVWWVLPGSFWRGVRAVRNRPAFVRALAIVAIGLLVFLAQDRLFDWMHHAAIANAEFWSQVPIGTGTVPPIAALTALVYRDATRPIAGEPEDG
jgi:hypothetical protein